ncbi:MAG: thioredoxin-disulfide reductase [Chloroflexi bacterium]|nr:thioredoxin-disulfide reductase [Chloroflexota bacterium]
MKTEYDVIIIGGGPAGLSAGIYTARARLTSLLIEKNMVGGLIADAELVENYPGFPEGISGYDLTQLMEQQAQIFGLETLTAEVNGIKLKDGLKVVQTTQGEFTAKAVIIAGGCERTKLGVPGEVEFTGKGVSYCATCDAFFFRDQPVAIVGGGNSAISEALQLTKFASRVTVIHRRQELRATRILQEKAFAEPKIEFLWNTVVESIEGEDVVKRLQLRDVTTDEKSTLNVAGIFVSTGLNPSTNHLKGILALDEAGYIITNDKMETDAPGIFAAGDIRSSSIRQTIAAAGDGAVAAIYAERFITHAAK